MSVYYVCPDLWPVDCVFDQIFGQSDSAMVLDCRDEEASNWLMFVKRARYSKEQNLVVYQQDNNIYFVTIKDIEPGTELLYWYASEYAQLLGKSSSTPKPAFRDSIRPKCTVTAKLRSQRRNQYK